MLKNTSGQKIGAQLVSASDGSAFTGSVTVYVTGDAGTQAAGSVGSGACTHEGNGYHTYAPAQAETNYDLIAFTFTGTGAVPVTVQVFTRPANFNALSIDASGRVDVIKINGTSQTAKDLGAINVTNLNTLSSHDPGETIMGATDMDATLAAIAAYIDTEVAAILAAVTSGTYGNAALKTLLDAIKAITDQFTFTGTGVVSDITGQELILSSGAIAAQAAAVWEEPIADHSGTAGSTAEALNAAGSAGDPWTTALPGSYSAGQAGYILSGINSKTTNLPADPADASDIAASFSSIASTLATIASYIDTEITAIQAAIAALNNLSAAQVMAAGDVDGYTLEEALKLCLAVLTGRLNGAGTTTITFKAADNSKTRITATTDGDGNRTALTLDATG